MHEKEHAVRSKILNQKKPCTIIPKETDRYIEKVQIKTPLTDAEAVISNKIKEEGSIYASLYFQPVIETKPLSIGSINIEDLTDCDIAEITTEQQELIESKYKNIGTQTLADFLSTKPPKFLTHLLRAHIQLIDSVLKLQSLGILHLNLNEHTILYDTTESTPVITDFRMATDSLENLDTIFPPYTEDPGWPIEVYALSRSDEQDIQKIAADFREMSHLNKTPTLAEYTDKTQFTSFHPTWDIYAIHRFIYSIVAPFSTKYSFMTKYKELLENYLAAEPNERATPQETIDSIRTIFQHVSKSEYDDFVRENIEESK